MQLNTLQYVNKYSNYKHKRPTKIVHAYEHNKHVLYRYYSSQRQVKLSSDDGSDTKIALKSPPAARWSLRGSDVMQHE